MLRQGLAHAADGPTHPALRVNTSKRGSIFVEDRQDEMALAPEASRWRMRRSPGSQGMGKPRSPATKAFSEMPISAIGWMGDARPTVQGVRGLISSQIAVDRLSS